MSKLFKKSHLFKLISFCGGLCVFSLVLVFAGGILSTTQPAYQDYESAAILSESPEASTPCDINVASNIGSGYVTCDQATAKPGDVVTITVNDNKYGYKFENLVIKDKDNNDVEYQTLDLDIDKTEVGKVDAEKLDIKNVDIDKDNTGKLAFIMPSGGAFVYGSYSTVAKSDYNTVKTYNGNMVWKKDLDTPANVSFDWGFDLLTNSSNQQYSQELSLTSLMFSNTAYYRAGDKADMNGSYVSVGSVGSDPDLDLYRALGFEDVTYMNIASSDKQYEADDVTSVYFAYKPVLQADGNVVNCYACAVRGTNGTLSEWSSNFDPGADIEDYWARQAPNWLNKLNHKGFDVPTNLIIDKLKNYIDTHNADTGNGAECTKNCVLFTGHSRGGAIANLLGSKVVDSANEGSYFENFVPFTYTFASPNTTTDSNAKAQEYASIYNVVNSDDIVPTLPYASWGFQKYGQVLEYSARANLSFLENTFGVSSYSYADSEDKKELNNYADKLLKPGEVNKREGLYKLPSANERYEGREVVYHLIGIGSLADSRAANINNSTYSRFCTATPIKPSSWFDPNYVEVLPSPAFCMHYIAHLASDASYVTNIVWGDIEIDGTYWDYTEKFIYCGAAGMIGDPHYLSAYYTLDKNYDFAG